MKQPFKISRPAGAPAGPGIRLPACDLAQVRAIAATAKPRMRSRRKPLLFSGNHAAAEAMARELRSDLFRIDLSARVSKYVGETEKNLRRVFDAAAKGGGILLFDEVDALLGKRSEVKDAHDRYASIEINFLLQRIEAYCGLAILVSKPKLPLPMALQRRFSVYRFPPIGA